MEISGNRSVEFQPINHPQEIIIYLTEGVRIQALTVVWTEKEELIQSFMTAVNLKSNVLNIHLPEDANLKKFLKILEFVKSAEFVFSMSLFSSKIFFKTRFLDHTKKELRFEIPKQIFRVQRRKYIRLPLAGDTIIEGMFDHPLFANKYIHKKLFDLCGGGVSFTINSNEAHIYQQGLTLKNFTMKLKGKVISAEAEIQYIKTYKRSKDDEKPITKVGAYFIKISPTDRKLITAFIFEESRKFYAKYVMENFPDSAE